MLTNKKVLVSAGCSHIFGSDLADVTANKASAKTWPARLANAFNLDYMCIAKPGASCQTVFRRVSVFLDSMLDTYAPDEILLIVQFPNQARFESIHRAHQWCGEDFPYCTNKIVTWERYAREADPMIVKKVEESIKMSTLAKDESQLLIDSLQAMLSTLLLCESKGVAIAWTLSDNWDFVHLPYSGYLHDNTLGPSVYDNAHKDIAKKGRFNIVTTHDLAVYKPKQDKGSPVFDTFSYTLWNSIQQTSAMQLKFNSYTSWVDWARAHHFPKVNRSGIPNTTGHYNEEAHDKAFFIMHEQLLRHNRGQTNNGTI